MSGAHTQRTKRAKEKWTLEQESGIRFCSSCGENKPLSDFPIRTPHRDGRTRYYAWCKSCHTQYQRINRLKNTFGLTIEQYNILGNVCPICGRSGKTRGNPVDHNHKTGLIRGRPCDRCNRGLAWFQDNPELFKKCAEYLENPPAIPLIGEVYGKKGRVKKKKSKNLSLMELVN